jgi:hypothetical protein
MSIKPCLALLVAAWLLAGCASFGEGIARGVLAPSGEPAEDTRQCEVSGPAFTGILPLLERQDGYPPIGQAGSERPILKVIMVHGVGTHVPGYSARLSANLARGLGLTVVAPEAKGFPIESPAFPSETLGALTVTRHTNVARDREMLFFELTLVADQPAGGHVPLFNGEDVLPSLTERGDRCVSACMCVRKLRGQENEHASMLVHVTRFNSVQRHVHLQVEDQVRHLRQRLTRSIGHEQVLANLRSLWERDFLPTSRKVTRHPSTPRTSSGTSPPSRELWIVNACSDQHRSIRRRRTGGGAYGNTKGRAAGVARGAHDGDGRRLRHEEHHRRG